MTVPSVLSQVMGPDVFVGASGSGKDLGKVGGKVLDGNLYGGCEVGLS